MDMQAISAAKKEKKAPQSGANADVHLRLSAELMKEIDGFRRSEADLPNRPEAIRRLVEKALKRGK